MTLWELETLIDKDDAGRKLFVTVIASAKRNASIGAGCRVKCL